ncbi:MAG: LysR substrate-binding domain-containing protein [Acidocella sp.]|nr:LysR substrate-binding domain-containing protein [Acidocella sp.]
MAISVSARHIRVFLAVAEAGSTAAAARALHLSQPSVSVAVKELEDILGRALFQRMAAKGLVPTEFGLRKLAQARQVAAQLAVFQLPEGADAAELAGNVAFGYFTTLGPQYVPAILRLMALRYPRVTVSLVEADLAELNRLLEAGRIELALSYDVEIAPRLVTETVAELTPYALLPEGHPLALAAAVPVSALAAEPFILIDLPLSREFLLSVFRAEGVEARIAYRTASLEMALGMVANGLGVSVLVTRQEGGLAYDGRQVARRPLLGSKVRQGVIMVRPDWAVPTPPAQALAACIREVVAQRATPQTSPSQLS